MNSLEIVLFQDKNSQFLPRLPLTVTIRAPVIIPEVRGKIRTKSSIYFHLPVICQCRILSHLKQRFRKVVCQSCHKFYYKLPLSICLALAQLHTCITDSCLIKLFRIQFFPLSTLIPELDNFPLSKLEGQSFKLKILWENTSNQEPIFKSGGRFERQSIDYDPMIDTQR